MAENTGRKTNDTFWLALPVLLLLVIGGAVWYVHLPLGVYALHQGKRLTHNYRIKKDAAHFPARLRKVERELVVLDSVLSEVEETTDSTDQRIPDRLYVWAEAAGFTTETIEAGVPQKIADHEETAVSITGNGSYASIGTFIANIENCSQSTRIRQLQIKRGEGKHLEVFIDFVVREKNGTTL